jgi:S-adenosyl-L-methionine hydrolase (adenosine-forming)
MDTTSHTISFLTDYGHADEFVGVCKSVIRQLAPAAMVIDITHDLPTHDVRAGSLALVRSIQYLADGVILAIVDPGVGTDRKAVAVEAGERSEYVFVGPDNGLLASAVAMVGGAKRAVVLTNDDWHLASPGATFAGRDIFSPVAAQLCNGVPLESFGEMIDPVLLLPGVLPLTRTEDGVVFGEALWVDRYGNVQLNIDPSEIDHLGEVLTLTFGERTRTVARYNSYAAIKSGSVGIVVDSYGLVSLCVDRFSAARELGIGAGSAVTLQVAT